MSHSTDLPLTDPQMQVIQHPAETLRTALVSSRCDLTDRYHKYSREERRLLEECLCLGDGSLFRPITVHSVSDWIHSHPEEPQDFQSFYSNPYPSKPIKGHSTIYLQIIGRWVHTLSVLAVSQALWPINTFYRDTVSLQWQNPLKITVNHSDANSWCTMDNKLICVWLSWPLLLSHTHQLL